MSGEAVYGRSEMLAGLVILLAIYVFIQVTYQYIGDERISPSYRSLCGYTIPVIQRTISFLTIIASCRGLSQSECRE